MFPEFESTDSSGTEGTSIEIYKFGLNQVFLIGLPLYITPTIG